MAIGTGTATLLSTGIMGGLSLWGAKKEGDRADDAMAMQGHFMQQGVDTAREQLSWNQSNYEEWKQRFSPILAELEAEAMAGRTPDYSRISADVGARFDAARQGRQDEMARYGIKPGDGQWGANERDSRLAEASAEVNARENARRAVQDDRFRRLSQVYGIGSGLQMSAMGSVNQGFNAVGRATSAMGGMYGNRADQAGRSASSLGAGAFRNFGNFLDTAVDMGGPPAAAASGNWWEDPGSGPVDYGQTPPGASGTAPWRTGG